ncbi:hypothetical protein TWF696_006225 [Orbilia brochopaga]|uniref:Secreted protein n=1 Tax=Orbilia brochopaga TaxID=3140254 RepID=A0AAV9UYY7_9PEZI
MLVWVFCLPSVSHWQRAGHGHFNRVRGRENGQDGWRAEGWAGGMAPAGEVGSSRIDIKVPVCSNCNCAFRVRWTSVGTGGKVRSPALLGGIAQSEAQASFCFLVGGRPAAC